MVENEIVSNHWIEKHLEDRGWIIGVSEGRLLLLELLAKAAAGYCSSHTEEGFLKAFCLMKKDRTPNKKGREFMCSMVYEHSNLRPPCYELMGKYRSCSKMQRQWDNAAANIGRREY